MQTWGEFIFLSAITKSTNEEPVGGGFHPVSILLYVLEDTEIEKSTKSDSVDDVW